jgi:CheY-like chemotaxis protein
MSRTFPGAKPAVLVVEDEALVRLNAVDMVEAAGFAVASAANAADAIRILHMRDDIRAVFTDVQMPGAMDGLGLMRFIKHRWPTVATLVTSGKKMIAQSDLPRGARFIAKPYLQSQVEAALRQLIGGSASA